MTTTPPHPADLAPVVARYERDGAQVVRLAGEIDLYAEPALTEALEQAAGCGELVVVDLTDVAFFDSTALAAVLAARRRVREAGGDLTLVVGGREATRVFTISGLDRVFTMTATLEEALRQAGR